LGSPSLRARMYTYYTTIICIRIYARYKFVTLIILQNLVSSSVTLPRTHAFIQAKKKEKEGTLPFYPIHRFFVAIPSA